MGSKESDAGTWHVTANEPGVCSASAKFVASMASTDAASGGGHQVQAPACPAGVYVVVIGLGLIGGAIAATGLLRTLATRRIRR